MQIPDHKTTIMVHCLATTPGWGKAKTAQQMVDEVRLWHTRDRGWRDIGYAAIFDYSGVRAMGRDLDGDGEPWDENAAAAKGWNRTAIHLALAGGRGGNANDRFEDHFTPQQDAGLRALIQEIANAAGRPMRLMGHHEVAAKACPCFDVRDWYGQEYAVPQAKTPPKPSNPDPVLEWLRGLLRKFKGDA